MMCSRRKALSWVKRRIIINHRLGCQWGRRNKEENIKEIKCVKRKLGNISRKLKLLRNI